MPTWGGQAVAAGAESMDVCWALPCLAGWGMGECVCSTTGEETALLSGCKSGKV